METMTFFDWVKRDGQAAVCRALGEGFHAVRIHRAWKALHAIDEGLIARCEALLGAGFNRSGTLDEWYRLRNETARCDHPQPSPEGSMQPLEHDADDDGPATVLAGGW